MKDQYKKEVDSWINGVIFMEYYQVNIYIYMEPKNNLNVQKKFLSKI